MRGCLGTSNTQQRKSLIRRARALLPAVADYRALLRVWPRDLLAGAAEHALDELATLHYVSVVIIRLSQMRDLDATGARGIAEIIDTFARRGITVIIKGVRPRHRGLIEQVGALDRLRNTAHLITSLPTAAEHARSHSAREPTAGAVGRAD